MGKGRRGEGCNCGGLASLAEVAGNLLHQLFTLSLGAATFPYYWRPALRANAMAFLGPALISYVLMFIFVTIFMSPGRVVGLLGPTDWSAKERQERELDVLGSLPDDSPIIMVILGFTVVWCMFTPLRTYELRWLVLSPIVYASSSVLAGGSSATTPLEMDIFNMVLLSAITLFVLVGAGMQEQLRRELFAFARAKESEAVASRELGSLLLDATCIARLDDSHVVSSDSAFREAFGDAAKLQELVPADMQAHIANFVRVLKDGRDGSTHKIPIRFTGHTASGPFEAEGTIGGVRAAEQTGKGPRRAAVRVSRA